MSNKKSSMGGVAVAVLTALASVSLVACGGNALSTADPYPGAADDPASTVILSQTFDDVEMGEQRFTDLSLPRAGTLVLTVRWNDQNNYVIAVLTGAGCPRGSDHAAVCQERRSIERQGREGREGVIDYAAPSGAYRLLVENEGPGRESIQVTATLN